MSSRTWIAGQWKIGCSGCWGHARKQGEQVDWTFYCILAQPGAMDQRARTLGAGVFHSPVGLAEKARFFQALRSELWRGNYDVLHCHHDTLSAVYLLVAL
jgi:hypothetical protein